MKVLRPIIHRDSYTRLVERHVRDHFWEVLFRPLVDLIADSGVAIDARENAVQDWRPMPAHVRGLEIDRFALPQIRTEDREDLAAFLGTLGVWATIGSVPASSLRASQSTFSPAKVEAARARDGERPILVSRDGYVLDGHHQWLAVVLDRPARRVPIIRFEEDAAALIPHANIFPGARRENILGLPEKSALVRALESGRVWYADGEFTGDFNAEISRELRAIGATLSKNRGTFLLPVDRLPLDVRGAAAASVDRSRKLHQALQDTLSTVEANALGLATQVNVGDAVTQIVGDLTAQFNGTIAALDVVTVPAEMTTAIAKALDADLTRSLDLPVKNFLEHEIVELRELVAQNAIHGLRSDKLAAIIEARWGVTTRKAAFLADQETSLLVSKFREQRYRAIGSRRYKWSTSHDDLVRKDHRLLNNEVFFWDSKPVTNLKTGARNHPGEDFRCRCTAMPIIDEIGDSGVYENARRVFRCARAA